MRKHFWSTAEENLLRAKYPNTRTQLIADELQRPLELVYQKAYKLGLSKSAEYLASADACRLRRGDNVGAKYRYPKGHVPANKGLRRPGWSPGRMKETQFKKGARSGAAAKNWRPIGTILPDPEGYLRIKVREAVHGKEPYGFGNTKVWPLLNRYTWEQHHGPIPPGHVVAFRDRNRQNCDISNLELLTQRENMLRNSVHKLPKPLVEVIQLKGAVKRQITMKTRKANGKEHDARSA